MSKSRISSLFGSLVSWAICLIPYALAQTQSTSFDQLTLEGIDHIVAKAQTGDPVAQLDLGKAYEDGNRVTQSDQQAMKWYRLAADQGNATAQTRVGLMFREGRAVERDKLEAVKWFRKAAKQRNANAMFNLGTAYYNGDGVAIDDVAAYAWFLLAQDFGSKYAVDAVVHMKEEKGNLESEAFERIGDMYQKGDELPQNPSEVMKWYRKAAENGPEAMQMKLAKLLLSGQGGSADDAEARDLCQKAAKRAYAPGATCLGELYFEGRGVERNLPVAARWFNDAANKGNTFAVLRLGQLYWKGDGVKQDKISAYAFTYLAAGSDLQEAKQEKERMEGELTPKEVKKGKEKALVWTRQHSTVLLMSNPPTLVLKNSPPKD